MAPRFVEDTAVTPLGDGRYSAIVDPAWRVQRPNGGDVAAILLRAVPTALDDPERPPRSLTIHCLRPAEDGAAEVAVTLERSGRRMSSLSARFQQGGRTAAIALVAAGRPQSGDFTYDDTPLPEVPPPDELAPPPPPPFPVPIR